MIEQENQNNLPRGIKVISIILMIIGIILTIIAPFFILGYALGSGPSHSISGAESLFGLIVLALPGILFVLISIYLKKRRNWARILTIILFSLLIILNIANESKLFQQWMDLDTIYYISWPMTILGLIVLAYLIFSKKVKEAFKK